MGSPRTINANDIRHKRWVKSTHWIITLSFLALAFSGFIILMCHPRLYWGETGNDLTPALFELPVSRGPVAFRNRSISFEINFTGRGR